MCRPTPLSSPVDSSRVLGLMFLRAIALLLLSPPILLGQGGRPAYIPLDDHQFDSVDLLNVNVLVHAPIFSKAGAIPLSAVWSANSYCTGATGTWQCGVQSPSITNFGVVAVNRFMGGASNGGATAYPLVTA